MTTQRGCLIIVFWFPGQPLGSIRVPGHLKPFRSSSSCGSLDASHVVAVVPVAVVGHQPPEGFLEQLGCDASTRTTMNGLRGLSFFGRLVYRGNCYRCLVLVWIIHIVTWASKGFSSIWSAAGARSPLIVAPIVLMAIVLSLPRRASIRSRRFERSLARSLHISSHGTLGAPWLVHAPGSILTERWV
jgi:hypothetical protein